MAISVDWGTRVITVPKADMVLIQSVPTEIRQLDLNQFWRDLKDIEDSDLGQPHPDIQSRNAAVTVGGVTLAPVVQIINGYTVTFEDGQYRVNLVGANSNVGDVTNVNQVSVSSANSAGLQDLSTLLAAAYNDKVCLDVVNGQPGTSTPLGTRSTPVDNFTDAKTIAENNGISIIQILEPATLSGVNFSEGFVFRGDSEVTVTLTIDPSAQVQNCSFENMTITGTLDGENTFSGCVIDTINYVNGFIFQCALEGTITLGGGAQCSILDCWSNVAGGGAGQFVQVDMGGSGNSLALRNYSGGLDLQNYAGGGAVSLDYNSGRCLVEPTVTGGTITVRGVCDVTDNSTAPAVVQDLTINKAIALGMDQVEELWQLQGLDDANPMTVTPTSRAVAAINQTISGDGATTTTVTRS